MQASTNEDTDETCSKALSGTMKKRVSRKPARLESASEEEEEEAAAGNVDRNILQFTIQIILDNNIIVYFELISLFSAILHMWYFMFVYIFIACENLIELNEANEGSKNNFNSVFEKELSYAQKQTKSKLPASGRMNCDLECHVGAATSSKAAKSVRKYEIYQLYYKNIKSHMLFKIKCF